MTTGREPRRARPPRPTADSPAEAATEPGGAAVDCFGPTRPGSSDPRPGRADLTAALADRHAAVTFDEHPGGRRRATAPTSLAGWSHPGGGGRHGTDETDEADDVLTTPAEVRYQDVELAGAGGMGMVMIAHDRRLGRDIAIKRVGVDGDDPVAQQRLAREAGITARLEHPGIVPVYDAGVGADGRSYYAMRLIRGRSLAELLEGAEDAAARLRLVRSFLGVCQAVAYAHRHRVVHLDLKPSNVMIGELGESLVVDWGLARELDGDGGDASALGWPAGTPAYLSPERARGGPGEATDDVWSLGAMLVELVTGRRLMTGTTLETLATLSESAPPPRRWPEGSPPELCAIADKALAWTADRRYRDAEALAIDVAAYLDGRRVGAHEYSTLELARRLLRAWRYRLAAVAAAIVAAIVVLAASRSRIEGERQRAVAAEHQTQAALDDTRAALTRALEQSAVAALLTGDLAQAESDAAAALIHGESVDARGVLAATRAGSRPARTTRLELPGCVGAVPDDEHHVVCRTGTDLQLWELPAGRPRWSVPSPATVAVSLRGRWVVALQPGVAAQLLDGADGRTLAEMPVVVTVRRVERDRDHTRAVVFDQRGLTVVDPAREPTRPFAAIARPCSPVTMDAVAIGARRTVAICADGRVLDVADDGSSRLLVTLPRAPGDKPYSSAALDADERTLALGGIAGDLSLVDLTTGQITATAMVSSERVASLVLLPGLVALAGEHGGARLWNLSLDAELLRLPERAGRQLAVVEGDVITAGEGWWRWSLTPPPVPRRFVAPAGLASATLSPDGSLVIAARGDGRLSVWSTATGLRVAEPVVAQGVVKRVDFSADGRRLVVGASSRPPTAILDTARWQPLPHGPAREGVHRLSYLAGDELVAVHYGLATSRWPAGDAGEPAPLGGHGYLDAERTPDRASLWLLAADGSVDRYRGGHLERVASIPGAETLAPSADGRRLAVARYEDIEVHDLATGTHVRLPGSGDRALDVAISPDDRWLAASTVAGTIDVWSLADGRWVAHLRGHQQRVPWVAFASGALWSASWDGVVLRWDLSALTAPATALAADAAATWDLPAR